METITTDVLVIGAGAAGIRAALAASKAGVDVLMVAKGAVAESGSTFSTISKGWGIQALVGEERTNKNLEDFYDDIMRVGLGRCDRKLVRVLVEEAGQRLEDLISYGIRFKKDSTGSYVRAKGCFSDCKRAFLTEDMGNVKQSFLSTIRGPGIKRITGYVVDLIAADETCWGAWVLTDSNEIVRVNAKATVLATGGGAAVFSDHLVTDEEIGDGYALAHRAGAELTNLEFIQFMLGLKKAKFRTFFPLSELAKSGVIFDSEGSDLFETYIHEPQRRLRAVHDRQKHFPFSCQDSSYLIDVAVAREWQNERAVFYQGGNSPHNQSKVINFSHAFNGGVKIDEKAESTVAGLFAAGEVAAGPHGADRIGGCMMTATQVFGERAGRFGASRASRCPRCSFPDVRMDESISWARHIPKTGIEPFAGDLEHRIGKAMGRYAMVLRWDAGLKRCKEILDDCGGHLKQLKIREEVSPRKHFEMRNMILTGRCVLESAILRKQSLGPHFRDDFSLTPRKPTAPS